MNANRLNTESPAKMILEKPALFYPSFKRHADCNPKSKQMRLTRFQETPKNWGPGKRAHGKKKTTCVFVLVWLHCERYRYLKHFCRETARQKEDLVDNTEAVAELPACVLGKHEREDEHSQVAMEPQAEDKILDETIEADEMAKRIKVIRWSMVAKVLVVWKGRKYNIWQSGKIFALYSVKLVSSKGHAPS